MDYLEKQKEKWLKRKGLGRGKFILIYGILSYTFPATVFYGLLLIIFGNQKGHYSLDDIITKTAIFGLFWIIAGLVHGNRQWKANIKKFG